MKLNSSTKISQDKQATVKRHNWQKSKKNATTLQGEVKEGNRRCKKLYNRKLRRQNDLLITKCDYKKLTTSHFNSLAWGSH